MHENVLEKPVSASFCFHVRKPTCSTPFLSILINFTQTYSIVDRSLVCSRHTNAFFENLHRSIYLTNYKIDYEFFYCFFIFDFYYGSRFIYNGTKQIISIINELAEALISVFKKYLFKFHLSSALIGTS